MNTDTVTPDWTRAPPDVLKAIAKRLHARIEQLHFRAVCPSFRSALPRPPTGLFPDSILKKTDFLKGPIPREDDHFVLVEYPVYVIEPIDSINQNQIWVVIVQQVTPGKVQIIDPLSGFSFERYMRRLLKPLNSLDYRVREVGKSYMLESVADHKRKRKVCENYLERITSFLSGTKVILTSFLDETDDGFAVMAVVTKTRKLFRWRNVDKKWSEINMKISQLDCFIDIICHNKKFYVMLTKAVIFRVDFQSLAVNLVAGPREDLKNKRLFLVESLNDLFLVAQRHKSLGRGWGIEYRFEVFKLNEETHEWVLVEDESELEDRVFFVGCKPFSVSASEFPTLRGNCIYFFEYDVSMYDDQEHIEDVRIYDLRTHTYSKLVDFPGFSSLFWPPPAWLKQRSSRSAGLSLS